MKYSYVKLVPLFLLSTLILVGWNIFALGIGRISGPSMAPSYKHGQTIIFNCLEYGFQLPFVGGYLFFWKIPTVGESVVLRHPQDRRFFIKRVVAVQGDPLLILGDDLVLGKRKIRLSPSQKIWLSQFRAVPKGHCFVLGDNTDVSRDSRDWGFIPLKAINGKLFF